MYGCILGFQRETRWPKCTPASTRALTSSACDCAITVLAQPDARPAARGAEIAVGLNFNRGCENTAGDQHPRLGQPPRWLLASQVAECTEAADGIQAASAADFSDLCG